MATEIDNGKSAQQNLDRTEQIESCKKHLQNVVDSIENEVLRKMCQRVIDEKMFQEAYGSATKHHNFTGGLLVHTSEVMDNALSLCKSQAITVSEDIVKTAIIYHDLGKMVEYKLVDGKIEYTYHKYIIHHLPKSYAWFMAECDKNRVSIELADLIGHCILAHHGRQEWSSPVTPQTTEAFVVHCADWISGKVSKDFYVRK